MLTLHAHLKLLNNTPETRDGDSDRADHVFRVDDFAEIELDVKKNCARFNVHCREMDSVM
jgi:hypothetical protein